MRLPCDSATACSQSSTRSKSSAGIGTVWLIQVKEFNIAFTWVLTCEVTKKFSEMQDAPLGAIYLSGLKRLRLHQNKDITLIYNALRKFQRAENRKFESLRTVMREFLNLRAKKSSVSPTLPRGKSAVDKCGDQFRSDEHHGFSEYDECRARYVGSGSHPQSRE